MTGRLATLYRPSLMLLTDLYQLTMAYGYWRAGRESLRSVFHLSFRKNPFGGGYAVVGGIADAVEWMTTARFDEADRAYLASLKGADGEPMFNPAFIERLATFRFTADVRAMREGTVAFAHEPLVRVEGPLWECQLAETALLNLVNYPTLVATKAARVCEAAAGDPVIEFGARRAQGVDGALSASRAAYIGGCAATSDSLAGRLFGIPVRGTHAHSWVMSFDTELEAFERYAEALPAGTLLLVDTYDTLEGVRRAAQIGKQMAAKGRRLAGVRLDSGDLAYLSIEARKILDEAGLHDARIVASNDLDEHLIQNLKLQGAKIDTWGVGTKLVTGWDQPALGGVYKLGAIQRTDGSWDRRLKTSETAAKASIPGILQVRRFRDAHGLVADAIWDELSGCGEPTTIVDPVDPSRQKTVHGLTYEDLLVPVIRGGAATLQPEPISAVRERVRTQLASLHPTIRRLVNPHAYPAGLEAGLHQTRFDMMLRAKGRAAPETSGRGGPAGAS